MPKLMKRIAASAILLIFIDTQLAVANAPVENICVYHMRSIGVGPDDDPLLGIAFATVPPEAKQQSHTLVPASLLVMDNLPRTGDEYKAIYPDEKTISPAIMGDIEYVRSHSRFEPMVSSGGKSLSDTFKDDIKTRSESVILIIGHNDAHFFRFRDGSVDAIGDMALACARAGKICVFISCNSKSFLKTRDSAIGVVHSLTFAEALSISSKVQKYMEARNGSHVSVDALGAYVGKQESKTKLRSRVVYIVVKTCQVAIPVIAVAILIRSLESCDKTDPKCPKADAS